MPTERFRIRDWWICATLFAANLLILGPWLRTDFSDQPWNNSYIYITIAQMFRDHKWGWNPLQYAGAPFHYLYPPIFHLLVDAIPAPSIGLAFHLVAGAGYALVPVALYILGRQIFAGRLLPAFAAIFYSFFPSPLYLLPQWRALAAPWFHAPWGFVAMAGYEEAAHDFAFWLVLLAIAAAWRNRWLSSCLCVAGVMLINWPAMIGLGLILIALAAAKRAPGGVAAITGTAYGLSAFWMTPGYFVSSSLLNRVVLRHTLSAAPFNRTTWLILLSAAILIGISLWRRIPARIALALTWIALTGTVVLSLTLAGNYLLPSPHRYILEFNAGVVLGLAALISLAPRHWQPWVAAALIVAGGTTAFSFVAHAWKVQRPRQDPMTGVAYQVAAWLNEHGGSSRTFVSGELDSTLPLWSNVPQVGGSGQDISNFLIFAAERQIAFGCDADSGHLAELWLRALNVHYLVVHGAASREYFHWFARPDKFNAMPVAWDDGAGDRVYSTVDFAPPDAVVVDLDEMRRLPTIESIHDEQFLESYVKWASGKRPAAIRWNGADGATLNERLAPKEAILVKINDDPGWRASHAVTESDPIGFLLVRGEAGQQTIRLRFGPSRDTWLGRAITAFTILVLLWSRKPRVWIAAVAVIPAVIAYAALMARVPSTVAAAEDAFVHLQPPLINPGGIIDGLTNRPPPFGRGRAIAVYGLNFGGAGDSVKVQVGERPAEVLYHGPNLVSFRMPANAPAKASVSVEVNGCRGNEFEVATE